MKKKLLTIIIIFLFIGLTVSPATIGIEISTKPLTQTEEIQPVSSDTFFDIYIKTLMKICHKPSIAAAIIQNDTIFWSKGYGYFDLENQKPTNEDILYLQASISKTVTATALMQLYEKGLFDLDDDINDYLPFEIRNPNHPEIPITIKMVLSHRSSLADDNLYWVALSYLPGDPDISDFPYPWLKEYLTPGGTGYSSTTWSDSKPGEEFNYANIGFSIIAYLVELLSNQSFNEYCKKNIFEPLHMYNSSYRLRDHNISNIAVPYEYKNRGYFRHPHYGIPLQYPAASLRTSIEELSHFIIAHMNGGVWKDVRILNESIVDIMHTAHFSPEDEYNYGLGWVLYNPKVGKKEYGHGGGLVGVLNVVTIIPDEDIAVILFSNELDSELANTRLEWWAFNAINRALFWKANQHIKYCPTHLIFLLEKYF
jgi:CubicO group peptidase (beta-lactamase class C family)